MEASLMTEIGHGRYARQDQRRGKRRPLAMIAEPSHSPEGKREMPPSLMLIELMRATTLRPKRTVLPCGTGTRGSLHGLHRGRRGCRGVIGHRGLSSWGFLFEWEHLEVSSQTASRVPPNLAETVPASGLRAARVSSLIGRASAYPAPRFSFVLMPRNL